MELEVPTVLVYALREDKVLLMQRNKEPNLGRAKFVYDADWKLVEWVEY